MMMMDNYIKFNNNMKNRIFEFFKNCKFTKIKKIKFFKILDDNLKNTSFKEYI